MKGKKWLLTWVIGLCMIFACAIGFTACGKGKSAGKFSAGTVSQIELGMSQKQVRDIIGKPDGSDEGGYTYYWYEDNIKNLLAEIEKEENEWDEDDFEEDLDDFGKEEVEDRLDQLYTQLEEMTYKFIMVTFSSDEKVTGVYLDCEHVYDEGNDYSSAREKVVRNVRLDVDKVEVEATATYTIGEQSTTQELQLSSVKTPLNSVPYRAEFQDGSYILRSVTPRMVGFTQDQKQVEYEWSDMIGRYNARVTADAKVANYSLGFAEGITSVTKDVVFEYKTMMEKVVLPSTLETIGEETFKDCYNLTEIAIPDSVTSIGEYAFKGCNNLTTVTCPTLAIKYLPKSKLQKVVLTSGDSIAEEAFSNCDSLTEIVIPDSVMSIGDYAFANCDSLTEIVMPDSVTSIGNNAFFGCNNLTTVTCPTLAITYLPESKLQKVVLTSGDSIGDYAFSGCSSLTEIVIPDSVTSIGYYAFNGCDSLQYTVKGGLKYLGNLNNPYLCLIGTDATDITSATIENGCKVIAGSAFEDCSSLTEIVIPDSVTSIGSQTFSDCKNLTEIVIPDSVMSIGVSAFYGCSSLTEIVIPDGVTSIGGSAFSGCDSLTSVTFGENSQLTSIGASAFYYCDNLTEIVIPDSITSIGTNAFGDCDRLTNIYITDVASWCNITGLSNLMSYGGRKSLYLNNELITELVIPDSVTSIGDYAFYGCYNLTEIAIPDSVTSIGEYAFYGCSNLTEIAIPDSVTSIGDSAFYYCTSLTEIVIPDSVKSIDEYAFRYCSKLTRVAFGENSQLTSIGASAFRDCYDLMEIAIPDSVTSIGEGAFYYCSNLTEIVIPDSVTSIGEYAFTCRYDETLSKYLDDMTIYCEAKSKPSGWGSNWNPNGCPVVWDCNNNGVATDGYIYTKADGVRYALKEGVATVVRQSKNITLAHILELVTYKGTTYVVTSIVDNAFYYCSSLTEIVIPDGVTSIGYYAFRGCDSLQYTVKGGLKYLGNPNNPYIYLVDTTTTDITSATIENGCKVIAEYAFYYCRSLTSVTFGENSQLTSIGKYTFYNCSNLTEIVIPDSVTSIGDAAFARCYDLTAIVIPDNVTSIGDTAFGYCDNLTSVTFGENSQLTSISASAFEDCDGLTEIVIPDSVMSISERAFANCDGLTEIVIPDGVTSIREDAFYDCDSLQYTIKGGLIYLGNPNNPYLCLIDTETRSITSATIENGCKVIADSAFRYCDGLTEIVIPDSVTSIGSQAFYDCSKLASVTFGENSQLTSIGDSAFYNCTSLTEIVIPDSVKSIDEYAFRYCSKLTRVAFGENSQLTSIGASAFRDCDSLTSVTFGENSQLASIGSYAFKSCDNLTEIVNPDSITSIGAYAFEDCDSLTNIYITDVVSWCNITGLSNLMSYGRRKSLYLNNELITKLVIPDSVTSIGDRAFAGCSSLTEIVIPDGVTSIDEYAFGACYNLTSVTFKENSQLTSIGTWAFYYCSNLTEITFNGTMEQWNNVAKGISWNYYVPATVVVCSDGNVTL